MEADPCAPAVCSGLPGHAPQSTSRHHRRSNSRGCGAASCACVRRRLGHGRCGWARDSDPRRRTRCSLWREQPSGERPHGSHDSRPAPYRGAVRLSGSPRRRSYGRSHPDCPGCCRHRTLHALHPAACRGRFHSRNRHRHRPSTGASSTWDRGWRRARTAHCRSRRERMDLVTAVGTATDSPSRGCQHPPRPALPARASRCFCCRCCCDSCGSGNGR